MSIWPWRTRPVVTPFTDDFTAPVLVIGENIPAFPFNYDFPDNLYWSLSSLVVHVTTAAGIRGTIPSFFHLHRGGFIYSGSTAGILVNNSVIATIWAPVGAALAGLGAERARVYPMPFPVFIYPHDTLEIDFPSRIPADTIDYITIHGKCWEVH